MLVSPPSSTEQKYSRNKGSYDLDAAVIEQVHSLVEQIHQRLSPMTRAEKRTEATVNVEEGLAISRFCLVCVDRTSNVSSGSSGAKRGRLLAECRW
jgi:hypothetical protein